MLARSGILRSNAHQVNTPACVLHTKFGVPAYLTVDLLNKIPSQYALHVPIQDLAEIVPNIAKSGGGSFVRRYLMSERSKYYRIKQE